MLDGGSADESIYFLCHPDTGPPEHRIRQHGQVCLAEGLRALGVRAFANVDYWRESVESDRYLLRVNPDVAPSECSAVVCSADWFRRGGTLPSELLRSDRSHALVLIDDEDGSRTLGYSPLARRFDLVLRCHFNDRLDSPENIRPWAFGLSERVLRELTPVPKREGRAASLLVNFRPQRRVHSVRRVARKHVVPKLERLLAIDDTIERRSSAPQDPYHRLQWQQTGRRHHPAYYRRLRSSLACAAWGGFFVPTRPTDQTSFGSRVLKHVLSRLELSSSRVIQWDSWRLWEALAAGCATYHLDLDRYGCRLPVMPENWRHYIGIDFGDVDTAIARIQADQTLMERVGTAGAEWARTHYSPEPTARRLLVLVDEVKRL